VTTPRDRLVPARLKSSLQRETLESQIYRALRTAILERTYRGGERLRQEELASAFGTSRIPVRDALKRLASDGLLVAGDGGTFQVITFGPEDVEEVYALRALIERFAAERACERATDETRATVSELTHLLTDAARAGDFESYTRHNTAFHMTLYEAAGMPRLLRIIEGLWVGRPPLTPIQIPGQVERSLEEHERMLAAIESSDPERLGALIEGHILSARDALLEHYAANPDAAPADGPGADR
jgi:DNA-binding GntR family transcriptional regulator